MPPVTNTLPTLLLHNARVLTMSPSRPAASAVAIKNNRILAVGPTADLLPLANPKTRRLDCHGMTLLPGFHDAHCHVLPLASRLLQLHCNPENAPTIPQLTALITRKARRTPPGHWIRAYGYDESLLKEGRHPTAADLDAASPDHPVRLDHRTGHAAVLNTAAMNLLGIGPNFQGPAHAVILRDESGNPNGVFLEMTSEIGRMMRPFRTETHLEDSVRKANSLLLSKGITAIQDAGANNGIDQWRTFRRLKNVDALTPRLTMMTGLPHANDDELQSAAEIACDEGIRLGAVKIMATATTGALHPSAEELAEITLRHHRKNRQLAFHAVEAEVIIAVAQAIDAARRAHPRPDRRHRVEHCAEAPPEILRFVKDSGATVVTQPGFIHHNGAKYLARVEPGLLPHLYPLAALTAKEIPWAAGSDAPVSPPDPLLHVQAAATRRTADGRVIGPNQSVSTEEALKAWTIDAARSSFQEKVLGSITPGKYADLVLLTADPTQTSPQEIANIKVAMTIIDGRIAWEA